MNNLFVILIIYIHTYIQYYAILFVFNLHLTTQKVRANNFLYMFYYVKKLNLNKTKKIMRKRAYFEKAQSSQ